MSAARRTFLISTLAALLGGCGYTAKGYRYEEQPRPPREANCPLEIFTAVLGRDVLPSSYKALCLAPVLYG